MFDIMKYADRKRNTDMNIDLKKETLENIKNMQHQDFSGKKCDALKEMTIEDKEIILSYTNKRTVYSCEYGLTTLFMWQNMYKPHLFFNENYMLIFEHYEDECYSLMPMCTPEYFDESFKMTIKLFEEIEESFEMYCVDEQYATFIKENYGEHFHVEAPRDLADYIYDAEKLRKLSGDKLRKKKNHINAFLRDYADRYLHRELSRMDKEVISDFLEEWCLLHGDENSHLQEEIIGIHFILENLETLEAKAIGVFVDGRLEAFSMASSINEGREAIIHVEKANTEIRGLYPFINQLFLTEYLTKVELVNREDDLGLEGLRKAKMSYEPLRLEHKYTITKIV